MTEKVREFGEARERERKFGEAGWRRWDGDGDVSKGEYGGIESVRIQFGQGCGPKFGEGWRLMPSPSSPARMQTPHTHAQAVPADDGR